MRERVPPVCYGGWSGGGVGGGIEFESPSIASRCHHGSSLLMPLGHAIATLMSNKLKLNRAALT